VEATHIGMGTVMAHAAYGPNAQAALQAVTHEARRLEQLLSRFVPDSDVAAINRTAGMARQTVSTETLAVLTQAQALSALCGGAFDITVAPLVDLWDVQHATAPPAAARIRRAAALVDYRDLTLCQNTFEAMLRRPGQALDLGGIGKGYASDAFMRLLMSMGITSAYANLGGNVSTLGARPDGAPWRVGIRHPRGDGLLCAVEMIGQAVVTSGDYERFFIDRRGKRYHHILDPRAGRPAAKGLISATVVAPEAMAADALSTALLASGMEAGLDWFSQYGAAQAILIDERLNLYCSKGLGGCLQTVAGVKPILI